jgi:NAD-dependent SIR2 family protein deacetylase
MLDISPTDRVFVLTGAGVSDESGIPTFRGVSGLWRNYRIEEVASPHAWARDPRLIWEFYSMRRRVAAAAKPNPAHSALAKLEQTLGERLFLCTQNVDNLHEQAGSKHVVHMHGELFKSRCDSCSRAPLRTPTFTSRQPNSPVVNAAAESAPTSAGSAKCRSSWIASSAHWTNAHSSLLWGRRAWSSPQRVSSPKLAVLRERSMWGKTSPQTHLRSRNAT